MIAAGCAETAFDAEFAQHTAVDVLPSGDAADEAWLRRHE